MRTTIRLSRDEYEALHLSTLMFGNIGAGADNYRDDDEPRYIEGKFNHNALTPCCIHGHANFADALAGEISNRLTRGGLSRGLNDHAIRVYRREHPQAVSDSGVTWKQYHKLFKFMVREPDGTVVEAVL